jgi:hypothetical protein
MKIEVTTLGMISGRDKIASVDDDALTSANVNDHYLAEDQDWQIVRGRRGHADVGELLLEAYDGSRSWSRVTWEGTVWLLVDDDGAPLRDDED